MHFVNSSQIRGEIELKSSGTTRRRISRGKLAQIEFPVPPLSEQQRIADKLDTLLKRVDACRERLGNVPAILKRFRQAVLAAATSGALTESWREKRALSDEWNETTVQAVAQVGTGSTPLRSNPAFFAPSGTPWITSSATAQPIVLSAEEFVTDAAIKAHRLKKFPIGALLVAMYGEGKTRGQVTELGIEATINQACAAVVVDDLKALKAFVKIALQANYLEMRDLAEGGNQPNLNLSKIKLFPLRLPSLEEQKETVRRVEKLFAFADSLEARYAVARKKVENLTPSLLAKAFRGELVEQDQNDEPASILLERIKAERATDGKQPRRTAPRRKMAKINSPAPDPLPIAAEPVSAYGMNIPQRILAAMKPKQEYSRADLLTAAGISEGDWLWAIRQLKDEGLVFQAGERRGAKYQKP
jgi:type I restriction enzyme S subunit